MFTLEQRDALRERVLRLAHEDERVVAGAAVGSLAVDGGDRFSDLDLTFGVAEQACGRRARRLDADAHRRLAAAQLAELSAVDHLRGYRRRLLADHRRRPRSFRPAGPWFRLLLADKFQAVRGLPRPGGGRLFLSTPTVAEDIFGGASCTRSMHDVHRARASLAGGASRRCWATTRSLASRQAAGGAGSRLRRPVIRDLARFHDAHVGTVNPAHSGSARWLRSRARARGCGGASPAC